MLSKWMRNLSGLRPRAQEDRAGARGLLRADQFQRKPLTLCSSLFSVILCCANKHDISHRPVPAPSCLCSPDTYSPVGILARLLLSLCEFEILNDKAGKPEVPESHVVRFLSCRPSRISTSKVVTSTVNLKMLSSILVCFFPNHFTKSLSNK